MDKGLTYELLNKEIFQTILNQSEIKNVAIQHDITLQGKTTDHQIDIYWEFELGGILYKTVVQTKNWNKSVDKGELVKFKGVLDDLPGQPRGIFVTQTGVQKGAKEVAIANEIDLFELAPIENKSLIIKVHGYALCTFIPTPILLIENKGSSITFVMKAIVFEPKFENNSLEIDIDWLVDKLQLTIVEIKSIISKIKWPLKQPDQHKFLDSQGNVITDLNSIYHNYMKELENKNTEIVKPMRHHFNDPTFFALENFNIPIVKVLSISTTVIVRKKDPIEIHMRSPNIVQFVLKNLNRNTKRIIGKKL